MPSNLHALILAAGDSSRMGQDKASLPWLEDQMLLPWMVQTLAATGWKPSVVVGPRTHAFWNERLPDTDLFLNPRPDLGKTGSVAIGLRQLPASAARILVTAVDQPRPASLYRLLAERAEESPIVVPDNAGRRGHPFVFDGVLRDAVLGSLAEESLGLRGFLNTRCAATTLIPCPVDGLRWDFNTPEAYREALAWFRSGQGES